MLLTLCDYSYKDRLGSWLAEAVKDKLSCQVKLRGFSYGDSLLRRPIEKLWNIPHIFLWEAGSAFENCAVGDKIRAGQWVIPDNYCFVVGVTPKSRVTAGYLRNVFAAKFRGLLRSPTGQNDETLFEEHFYFIDTKDPRDGDLEKLIRKLNDWRELA